MITAAMNGELDHVDFKEHEIFGLHADFMSMCRIIF